MEPSALQLLNLYHLVKIVVVVVFIYPSKAQSKILTFTYSTKNNEKGVKNEWFNLSEGRAVLADRCFQCNGFQSNGFQEEKNEKNVLEVLINLINLIHGGVRDHGTHGGNGIHGGSGTNGNHGNHGTQVIHGCDKIG